MRTLKLNRWYLFGLLIVCLATFLPNAGAQTTSGTLTANETWSGTIMLTGDVIVPAELTLTIEPGAEIIFPAGSDDISGGQDTLRSELIVNGSLVASGTNAEPILFTSDAATATRGDWTGITFNWGTGTKTLQLAYCEIEYATRGIVWQASTGRHSGTIANTTIRHTNGNGLYVYAYGGAQLDLDLQYNTLTDNNARGLYLYVKDNGSRLSGAVTGNQVNANGGNGIHVYTYQYGVSDLEIVDNQVYDNKDYGIYLYTRETYNTTSSRIDVVNNTVHDSGTGIYSYVYYGDLTVRISGNTVYNSNEGIYCHNNRSYKHQVEISGNEVYDNSSRGIYSYSQYGSNNFSPVIRGNTVYGNAGDGIQCNRRNAGDSHMLPLISLNEVTNNGGRGLNCFASGKVNILYNDVHDNGGVGLYINAGNGTVVNFNNLYGNSGAYELENGGGGSVNARYNYWGSLVSAEMQTGGNPKNITGIYDIYDNTDRGTVYYDQSHSSIVLIPDTITSRITYPADGSAQRNPTINIKGIAVQNNKVSYVEVSYDGGNTWLRASGTVNWALNWTAPMDGTYTLQSKAVYSDSGGDVYEIPAGSISVTVDSSLPTNRGVLAADETWSGEILLTGDVTVPAGTTLTIEPGSTVRFLQFNDDVGGGASSSHGELIVNGSLVASGTSAEPILFTSNAASPARGDWTGITISWGIGTKALQLAYCEIEYATRGIMWQAGTGRHSGTIANTIIRQTGGNGLYVYAYGGAQVDVDVRDSRFTDNNGRGLYLYVKDDGSRLSGTVTGNQVDGNGGNGIHVYTYQYGVSDLEIADNTVYDNKDYGIYLYTREIFNRTGSRIDVVNNTVHDSGTGIFSDVYYGDLTVRISGNTVYNSTEGIYCHNNRSYKHQVEISGNEVYDNSSRGIYCYSQYGSNNFSPVIRGNTVYGNAGDGIQCNRRNSSDSHMLPLISLNEVTNNGGRGLYCFASGKVNILYNDVHDNGGVGLHINAGNGTVVSFNNLYGNSGIYELENGGGGSINARYNYWGSLMSAELQTGGNPKNITGIYDIYDNTDRGTVYYGQWQSAAVTLPQTIVSHITAPVSGSAQKSRMLKIEGIAVSPQGISYVDVSLDNGITWYRANGTTNWFLDWEVDADGTYAIFSRAVYSGTQGDIVEVPGAGTSVTVDGSLPTTSGELTEDETWSGAVLLTGDVWVPSGVTLTIEPGTTVSFLAFNDDQGSGSNTSRSELIVHGSLVAEGTASQPIVFTTSASSPAKGDWYGIRVVADTTAEAVSLSHCTIAYANLGLSVIGNAKNVSVSVADSVIEHTGGNGIYVHAYAGAQAQIDIRENRLTDNNGRGLYLYVKDSGSQLSGTVTGNQVNANGGNGIHVYTYQYGVSDLEIADNQVYDNKDYGIYLYTREIFNRTGSRIDVVNNTVYDSGTGIYSYVYYGDLTVRISGNTVYNSTEGIYCHNNRSYKHQVEISGNEVYDNSSRGIYCYSQYGSNNFSPVIRGNTVYGNAGDGIQCNRRNSSDSHMLPLISLNEVTNNGGRGLYCFASGKVNILYNDVHDNGGVGLYINAGNGTVVSFNNLNTNGGAYELENGGGGSVNARYNYWGSLVTAEMQTGGNPKNITGIYDIYENTVRGTVYYDQWQPSAVTLPVAIISKITAPVDGSTQKSRVLKIEGIAVSPQGISYLEVSPDNGASWYRANGTTNWSLDWEVDEDKTHSIFSRAIYSGTQADIVEVPGAGTSVTVDGSLPTTSGELTEDETWSGAVLLTGDVWVPSGVTLTIEPGTTVSFPAFNDDQGSGSNTSRSELIVRGSLVAEGTVSQPIVFTSSASSPAKGDWYGIRVVADTTAETVSLSHCTIAYANLGLSVIGIAKNVSVNVADSVIEHTSGDGIYVHAYAGSQAQIDIRENRLTDNNGRGLYLYVKDDGSRLSGTVTGNQVDGNGGNGIHVYTYQYGVSDLEIADNTVYDNKDYGIYLYTREIFNRTGSRIDVVNNTVHDSGTGIYSYVYYGDLTVRISGNTVYNSTEGIYCHNNRSYKHQVEISGNEVYDNSSRGIYCYSQYGSNNFSPVIRGNKVYGNAGDGIQCNRRNSSDSHMLPLISLNEVTNNGGRGLYCFASGKVNILYNDVHDNGGVGLHINAGNGTVVSFNNLYGNSGTYELENGGGGSINARYNYWGSLMSAELQTGGNPKNITGIYDIYDNTDRGTVYYGQWQSAAVTLPQTIVSHITAPVSGSAQKSRMLKIEGIAVSPQGISYVDISLDNGITWYRANGTTNWFLDWEVDADGTYAIFSRAVYSGTQGDIVEVPGAGTSVTVDGSLPTTSGELTEDETWSGAVLLTGDVWVPSGVTLTIEPGTTVRFLALNDDQGSGSNTSRSELIVRGSLVADGTADNPIVFSSSADNPAKGDWYGIRVVADTTAEAVSLSHCTIAYANLGLSVIGNAKNVSVSVADSVIEHTGGNGIYVHAYAGAQAQIDIRENRLTDNNGRGLYLYVKDSGSQLSGTVTGNQVNANGGNGIHVYTYQYGVSDLEIADNQVYDNKDYGIYLYTREIFNRTGSRIDVVNNTVYDSGTGIYSYVYYGDLTVRISGNTVYNSTEGIYCHNNRSYKHQVEISGNEVYDNSSRGIYCYSQYGSNNFSPVIRGNTVYGNTGDGIQCDRRNSGDSHMLPLISLNEVTNNGGRGLYCFASGKVNILYNDVHDNGGVGLYINAGNGTVVSFNNLNANGGAYELENGGGGSINSQYNYWGSLVTVEMQTGGNPKNITGIYDIYDNTGRGTVYYGQWQSAAVTLPQTIVSHITAPVSGSAQKSRILKIEGIAVSPMGIGYVEVSPDGGVNWHQTEGTNRWSYDWEATADGDYTLYSRAVYTGEPGDLIETPSAGVTATIDSSLPSTSGELTEDETWSGTVLLTGDVWVPSGVTLTIAPGTTVSFLAFNDDQGGGSNTSRSELIVRGSLVAQGTEDLPIVFTSSAASPGKGDWYGIRVVADTTAETVSLSHCTIAHASLGLSVIGNAKNVSVSVADSVIEHTGGDGIYVHAYAGAQAQIDIRENRMTDNNGRGMYLYVRDSGSRLSGTVTGNQVDGNGGNGIHVYTYQYGVSDLEIADNTVYDNKDYGIYLYTREIFNRTSSRIDVVNNTVHDSGTGIFSDVYYGDLTVRISGNTVYNGTEGIYCHNNRSYKHQVEISDNDVHDNISRGIYCYSQYGSNNFSPVIRGNTVTNNGGDGIQCDRRNSSDSHMLPLFIFNDVYNNGGRGVYSNTSQPVKILFNNIYLNTGHDLYNDGATSVDARYNYWGTNTTAHMQSAEAYKNIGKIYDIFDNSGKGRVDYAFWSGSEIDLPADLMSRIYTPFPDQMFNTGNFNIRGIAHATNSVAQVEVSFNDGITWQSAQFDANYPGNSLWSLPAQQLAEGTYNIQSRVIDGDGNVEVPVSPATLVVDQSVTTISGSLSDDETWSGSVVLSGDVTIPEGTTLTILPGTTIQMPALLDDTRGGSNNSKTELIVNGSLVAEGTADNPIVFTSGRQLSGDWIGIRVLNGSSRFKHVVVAYATNGINISASRDVDEILITESTIRNNSSHGIYINADSGAYVPVTITSNTINENGSRGIYLRSYAGNTRIASDICGNTLAGNGDTGIYFLADDYSGSVSEPINICNNVIDGHAAYGIYVQTDQYAHSAISIEYNTILSSGVGIYAYYYYGSSDSVLGIISNRVENGTTGIEVYANYASISPQFINNVVLNNNSDGIACWFGNTNNHQIVPFFKGNQVVDNDERGIYMKATDVVIMVNNSIYDNVEYDVYNDSANDVTANDNWWGVNTTNEMNTRPYPSNIFKIFDSLDDSSKGLVAYANWLELYQPPNSPELNPVSSPTSQNTQVISGTKDVGAAIVLNGVEVVAVDDQTTWSHEMSLSEGINLINVYARNIAGMTSSVVVSSILMDSMAPGIYTSDPADGSFLSRAVASVNITLFETHSTVDPAATLNGATIIDGLGQPVSGQWTSEFNQIRFLPVNPLTDGTYTLTIFPTDQPLGNRQEASISFTVDLIKPATPTIDGIESPTRTTPQNLSGFKEAGTSVWLGGSRIVALDDTTQWTYSLPLSEGQNARTLYARDRAGNQSDGLPFNIIFDRTPPALLGTDPVNGSYVRTTISQVVFNFSDATTALDAEATRNSASLKDSTGAAVIGTWDLQPPGVLIFSTLDALAEGSYTATVSAHDIAGNSVTKSISFTYDLTPPDSPTLDPVTSPTNFRNQTLTGTKSANSSIWINAAEVIPIDAATSWTYQVTLGEGRNTFEIYSKDAAGNLSGSAFGIIDYDETAPLPILPEELVIDTSGIGSRVTLDWTAYQEKAQNQGDIAEYRIYVSDRLFTRITDMTALANLPPGTFLHVVDNLIKGRLYYFAVVAVDTNDNINASVTPKSGVPTDTIPPSEVVGLQVNCLETQLVFTWTPPADPHGDFDGYRVYFNGSVDGEVLTADQAEYTASGLLPASAYDFKISAVDQDGNQSTGRSMTAITLLDNPIDLEARAFSGWVNLSWSAVQPGAYVQAYAIYVGTSDFSSVDGMTPYTAVTTPAVRIENLTLDVTYYFAVTSVNLSGGERKNVSTQSATPFLDDVGPQMSGIVLDDADLEQGHFILKDNTISLAAEDYSGVTRVEFFLDDALIHTDGIGPEIYTCPLSILGIADGEHVIKIRAYDILNNTTTRVFDVSINHPPPNDCFRDCVDNP